MRPRLPTFTPERYARIALVSLVLLTLIIATGGAVRLTGSGLGCPDWPRCHGGYIAPLELHAWIEFGNRLLSGLVGLIAVLAGLGAFRRRPFRRDLAVLGSLLPLGVVAQAVLGGFTVRSHLAPGFVMAHYLLALACLVASMALWWRARREPGHPVPHNDRLAVWATRGLLAWATLVVFGGTAATASGPHAGGAGTGVHDINRLGFKGEETLDFTIHWHGRTGTVLGLAALATWWLARRRGTDPAHRRALTWVCCLVAAQGAVGMAQYLLELPPGLVWVHVTLAAVTWLALLCAWGAAGRPAPAAEAAPSGRAPRRERVTA